MKTNKLITGILILVLALALPLAGAATMPVQAAPLAIPTAISIPPGGYATGSSAVYTVFSGKVITTDTRSTAMSLYNFSTLDIQFTTNISSPVTTTIKLQHSLDGINWADGQSITNTGFTSISTTEIIQRANFGRYTAVYVDVGATDTQTYTVLILAK